MTKPLTQQDRKTIRYQCRMGYFLPLMIFVIGSIITLGLAAASQPGLEQNSGYVGLAIAGLLLLMFLLSLNRD